MRLNLDEVYPLTDEVITKIIFNHDPVTIQLSEYPPDNTFWTQLNEKVLRAKSDVYLRLFNYDPDGGVWTNLDFLATLTRLKNLTIQEPRLMNLDFLNSLDLEKIHVTSLRKSVSIRYLAKQRNLISLSMTGKFKDLSLLSDLEKVKNLALWSIGLNLKAVAHWKELIKLRIFRGKIENLELMPDIGKLKYVEIYSLKDLVDAEFLSRIPSLEFLNLNNINNISSLPSFRDANNLGRIQLESMKALKEFDSLSNAKNLEEFVFYKAQWVKPENLRVLRQLPKLSKVYVEFNSDKKQRELELLLSDYDIDFKDSNSKFTHLSYS